MRPGIISVNCSDTGARLCATPHSGNFYFPGDRFYHNQSGRPRLKEYVPGKHKRATPANALW